MRRVLDALYGSTMWLAGIAMVLVLVSVLISIITRQLQVYVPGIASYAGYFAAASGSFALAGTFKAGEHVRVSLLLGFLHGTGQKALEVWTLLAGTVLTALYAYYSCSLVYQSYIFNDISTDSDGTALWIPQLAMALGALVLTIAFVDELLLELSGKRDTVANELLAELADERHAKGHDA